MSNDDCIIKMRGLPWSTTVDEIIAFFDNSHVRNGAEGVHIVMAREGRPSGEAFIEMETDVDVEEALKKDREYMGSRYMEVFKSRRHEMEYILKKSGANLQSVVDDGCVRLRGLPFDCSKEEIAQFFTGLEIVPNGITLPMDPKGRSTGEAYVQFRNKDMAEKALLKHKEKIGHRYIEIFRSSLDEIYQDLGVKRMGSGFGPRPSPYDARDRFGGPNRFRSLSRGMGMRGGFSDGFDSNDDWIGRGPGSRFGNDFGGDNFGPGGGLGMGFGNNFGGGYGNGSFGGGGGNGFGGSGGGGGGGGSSYNSGPHCVHMRGLPFRATKQDVADFFRPVIPLSIDLLTDNKGRASGEADVEFRTHDDAVAAMAKNKSNMQHRYIELFLNSPSPKQGFGGNMAGSGFGGRNFNSYGGGGGNRRF